MLLVKIGVEHYMQRGWRREQSSVIGRKQKRKLTLLINSLRPEDTFVFCQKMLNKLKWSFPPARLFF